MIEESLRAQAFRTRKGYSNMTKRILKHYG